jgi:hypothetical protein
MKTGWEIKPLGWLVLIALVGTVIYLKFYRKKPKKEKQHK